MVSRKELGQEFLKTMGRTLFLIAGGVLFAIALSAFITPGSVRALKARVSYPLLVVYAELIGFAAPGPRYIIYPILAKLKEFGLDAGVILALISGHVLIEPSTALMEVGFFGYRFPLKRFVVSLIVGFAAAMLTRFLTYSLGWRLM